MPFSFKQDGKRASKKKKFAIPASDPVEAIKFLMEQNNLSRKDLERYIGPSGRVSEVLKKKRNRECKKFRV